MITSTVVRQSSKGLASLLSWHQLWAGGLLECSQVSNVSLQCFWDRYICRLRAISFYLFCSRVTKAGQRASLLHCQLMPKTPTSIVYARSKPFIASRLTRLFSRRVRGGKSALRGSFLTSLSLSILPGTPMKVKPLSWAELDEQLRRTSQHNQSLRSCRLTMCDTIPSSVRNSSCSKAPLKFLSSE